MKALSQALAVMLLTGYLTGVIGASGNAAADTRQPAIGSLPSQATARTEVSPAFSCRTPADEQMAATCAALERQILDATVYLRFTLDCPASGEVFHLSSRATVMDERTVLTHDHFKDVDEPGCVIIALEVFSGRGKALVKHQDRAQVDQMLRRLRPDSHGSRFQARKVVFSQPLFSGLTPAVFESFAALPTDIALTEWGEVAEINGEPFPRETRIQWVRPLYTEVQAQAFGLVLDQAVYHGASGGGVFRYAAGQIVHIGNVWGTWEEDHRSLVALNRAEVLR
ncbi:MAG: hypothetical protein MUC51_03310 [Anaerolineae bacterium]|nr:hypothetical protein [Anaerolineae bacterium]